MVYTLAQGAHNYNRRTHYSLYGGVEYYPDRAFALKELLPLVAIPVVSVAILTAMLSFHVPTISPTTGASGSESGKTQNNKTYSLVLSPSGAKAANPRGNSAGASPNTATSPLSPAPLLPLSPSGTDNGQGIIGGMGGGGGITSTSTGTTVTDPTGSTTTSTGGTGSTTGLSSSVSTPLLQTSTTTSLNTSTNTAQAGVDVFVAPTSTSLSGGTSLTP
ncbi:MAG TPA: hypothetical protein VFI84_04730 [Candidatus Saccharimonadales bacterium]|nr:hypothetical protein [Candidatus Saccharimonadales bacterium]